MEYVRFSKLTVPTASRGEPHVWVLGMVPNHRVLVVYIVVIIPGPCTLHLEVLESRHPEKAQKLGKFCIFWTKFRLLGHDLGQRVRIIKKRNRWVDLKILS